MKITRCRQAKIGDKSKYTPLCREIWAAALEGEGVLVQPEAGDEKISWPQARHTFFLFALDRMKELAPELKKEFRESYTGLRVRTMPDGSFRLTAALPSAFTEWLESRGS